MKIDTNKVDWIDKSGDVGTRDAIGSKSGFLIIKWISKL
jgi:hypothetical protein